MTRQLLALWHSLSGVSLATVTLVLLLALCQLGLQALRLWAILPRHAALTPARNRARVRHRRMGQYLHARTGRGCP